MARPRIFDKNRKAINIYLHKDQYDYLKALAKKQGTSPSDIVRRLINTFRKDNEE